MTRNQFNLYINNISERTDEDRLFSYFSQFGTIESHTFFAKNSQRKSAAAIITYGLSVDVSSIIEKNQRLVFDEHHLFLRRTLPMIRPAYERFMSSNDLLVSLDYLSNDEEFNEVNIRKYFSKYGSIVSCRMVIRYTTILIDFVETNSVDSAILAEPHFYNENELILRKYVSPDRIGSFRTERILFDQENKKNRFSFSERIRRLNHITEAVQFGQKVQLKIIKSSYEERKFKFNQKHNDEMGKSFVQLRTMCGDMNDCIQRMKEKNDFLKLEIERNQRRKKIIIDLYEEKITGEQNRMKELQKAIDSF